MYKDLIISNVRVITSALNGGNEYIEDPSDWAPLVERITELCNHILTEYTDEDDIMSRFLEHTAVLADTTANYSGDYPDIALYTHINDIIDWLGNLC